MAVEALGSADTRQGVTAASNAEITFLCPRLAPRHIDATARKPYPGEDMEVHLAQSQEAQLNALAAKTGRGTDRLVRHAVARMIEYDAGFLDAVEAGRAAARDTIF